MSDQVDVGAQRRAKAKRMVDDARCHSRHSTAGAMPKPVATENSDALQLQVGGDTP
jgi:hypothetical protein